VIAEFGAPLNSSQGFDQVGLIGKHIARMIRIEDGLGQRIEPPIARALITRIALHSLLLLISIES
jgi:hypothetical protein